LFSPKATLAPRPHLGPWKKCDGATTAGLKDCPLDSRSGDPAGASCSSRRQRDSRVAEFGLPCICEISTGRRPARQLNGETLSRDDSNLTLQPSAMAVRKSVVRLMDVFSSSRTRLTAARLVPKASASLDTLMSRRFICLARAAAMTFLRAAASTSS